MAEFNRRDILNMAAVAGAVAPMATAAQAQTRATATANSASGDVVWLDGAAPAGHDGQTFGLPWPKGTQAKSATFALRGGGAVQTWPTAYWPDGSIKWTAHAVPAGGGMAEKLWVEPGKSPAPASTVSVRETPASVEITSGALVWKIGRKGADIITSASVAGRETLRNVRLVALTQNQADLGDKPLVQTEFTSDITAVTVEQTGPVRAVVKVQGVHKEGSRGWLPFSLRLYFYAGSEAVKVMHSFIFDGDENKDFIRGLGLRGTVPMTDALYDRHVRFGGLGKGVYGEAVQGLTGLRRDPGRAYREAQVAGVKVGPLEGMSAAVRNGLKYVYAWGDYTLSQPNAEGYTIRKRTKDGYGWIDSTSGKRAAGLAYIGGASGGVAFGMNDFWKRPPTRLDIRNAHSDAADFTVWMWSPDAPAMDMRFFHDGMGMETYAQQTAGLDITYEDYEKDWGRPYGVARTNELTLWSVPATPSRERFAQMSENIQKPPRLMATPARLNLPGLFGDWSLPSRSSPTRIKIENQNDYLLDYYMKQIEEHHWYGFWNHGDFMHSYDSDRHVWKYDIGGFAWDNSELSTDLWLWYSFLRTGRADLFRMAEAMTRHTREVDVCHIGPYKGFGTRHGVQHWADSSKQPRVSTAGYARIYYYLTADERVGDLMHDLIGSEYMLQTIDIGRKGGGGRAAPKKPDGVVGMSFGTSWTSLAFAWLAEWERTGDTRWRDRIVAGMDSLAALPKQWFASSSDYDLKTGRFVGPGERVGISHLNAVFGAFEFHSEIFNLIDNPKYKDAWLDYCQYYNAPAVEFTAKTGAAGGGRSLVEGHSRGTAYAAVHRKDPKLAERAWIEFLSSGEGIDVPSKIRKLAGPDVLEPIVENTRVSTNWAAQWGLAAIQNLALVSSALETAAAKAPPVPERTERPGAG